MRWFLALGARRGAGVSMAVDVGIVLDGNRSLKEVTRPLGAELTRCFWMVDIQSGLFTPWRYESDENEAIVEEQYWDLPEIARGSTQGLRPGTIPEWAGQIIVDEWSYY